MPDPLKCPKCGNDKAACVCPKGSAAGSGGGSEAQSADKKDTVPQAILTNAEIPALSAAWVQKDETHSIAGGAAIPDSIDPDNSKTADELTLFQAASLSKPISAAIILDLASRGEWDLDKPLAEMGVPFGSANMQTDPPRYAKLTTRMILAQCSGLPNPPTGSEEKFIAEPGSYFTYSGFAYECLKEVVEQKLNTTWGKLAQDFFDKVSMTHSTFQLPEKTHLKDSTIALGCHSDCTPGPAPSLDNFKEVPAASLLTTPEDYVRFLQYCYSQPSSNDTNPPSLRDLFSSHTKLNPETPEAYQNITWGLGMGIFKDGEREIAFHWGNNKYSHAFCAMDMKTGDVVACFVNSPNGPNVFQTVSENVVGDMSLVFEWLSKYSNFNPVVKSKSPEAIKAWADDVITRPSPSPKPEPTPQKTSEEERDWVSIRALPRMGMMGSSSHPHTAPAQQDELDQHTGMKK